jgi:hypothetical protein
MKKVNVNSQVTLGYGKSNVSFDVKSIDVRVLIVCAALALFGLSYLASKNAK